MSQPVLRCFLAIILVLFAGVSRGQELVISDIPLFLGTDVPPNIMLMLDNSGSMSNIVPDTPYDPNTTYNCPTSKQLSAGNTQVSLRVVGGAGPTSGYPFIWWDNSTSYDWGTTNDNGPTGKSKRCFNPTGVYNNVALFADSYSSNTSIYSGSYLDSAYIGNYLNWYFGANHSTNVYGTTASDWGTNTSSAPIRRRPGTKQRLEIAKSASINLIDSLTDNVRTGLFTYYGSDGGSLQEIMGGLTTSKKTAMKNKIVALTATGNTPLAEALSDIGRYYATGHTGDLTLHPGQANSTTATVSQVFINHGSSTTGFRNDSGTVSIPNPIQEYCQKSFAVLLTDGRPQQDRAISNRLKDYTGDCAAGLCIADSNATNLPATPLTTTSYQNGTKIGRSYESQGSDYLDDVAMALYDIDLRPDLPSGGKPSGMKNNVSTFLISFADMQALNDELMPATAYRGGGEFLRAGNEAELVDAFQQAALTILESSTSAAALAANSTSLETGTTIYRAKFNSSGWSGQLIAYPISADGTIATEQWNTDTTGKIPLFDGRNIYTLAGANKVEFGWDNLTDAQKKALANSLTPEGTPLTQLEISDGQENLNWIRGHRPNEQPSGTLRRRTKLLGDIIHSTPFFVGQPANTEYETLSGYTAFRDLHANRTKMLYVGANDGMLHAFNADNGIEQFAFIPNATYSNLSNLTDPNYSHRFFVDGSPKVFDAQISGVWKSILVGTTGAGGRSVFALDVTNPDSFTANQILWEFTDPDLGYTIGHPSVGRLQNGTWVAVFGNGYNSGSLGGTPFLFVVNLANGTLIKKIPVLDLTRPNGLATPALLADENHNLVAAYAGDLRGNLWKFDLTNLTVAFGGDALFQARDSSGQIQPITVKPTIGRYAGVDDNGYMIFFGTGKYFEAGDHNDDASPIQSFYGIWDNPALSQGASPDDPAKIKRSQLQPQIITSETEVAGNNFRTISKNALNWNTQYGWYIDLVVDDETAVGERVVDQAVLNYGRAVFVTRILFESDDPCLPSTGTSWIMAVDMLTGGRLSLDNGADRSVFDVNRDQQFDRFDYINGPTGDLVSANGFQATAAGISTGFTLLGSGGKYDLLLSGTESLTTTAEAYSAATAAAEAAATVARAAREAAERGGSAADVAAAARAAADAIEGEGSAAADAVADAAAGPTDADAAARSASQIAALYQGQNLVGVAFELPDSSPPPPGLSSGRRSWRQLR